MELHPVPFARDNYAYLIVEGARAVVIDPGAAEPLLDLLSGTGLKLVAILCTHHHSDHVGGNAQLQKRFPGLRVYGHELDEGRIPGLTHTVQHGDSLDLLHTPVTVLHTPGHTRGSVTYCIGSRAFTGDTLFVAGCGRLFEGTAAELCHSLHGVLGQLPGETELYPGHEYAHANFRFARSLLPSCSRLIEAELKCSDQRQHGLPWLPTTVQREQMDSPFFRLSEPELLQRLGLSEATPLVERFAAVRQARNEW